MPRHWNLTIRLSFGDVLTTSKRETAASEPTTRGPSFSTKWSRGSKWRSSSSHSTTKKGPCGFCPLPRPKTSSRAFALSTARRSSGFSPRKSRSFTRWIPPIIWVSRLHWFRIEKIWFRIMSTWRQKPVKFPCSTMMARSSLLLKTYPSEIKLWSFRHLVRFIDHPTWSSDTKRRR